MLEDAKYLILTQGNTHPTPAKLASTVLRYRPESVVGLLDSDTAGQDARDLMRCQRSVPIVASLQEGLALSPNALLIGITPPGGRLPEEWNSLITDSIKAGLNIVSGMHEFLSDHAEYLSLASRHGVRLIDLRRSPDNLTVNKGAAAEALCFRVHTVGTDCNCGKKVTSLEICQLLKNRGQDCEFLATGQSGILISSKGIAMDHVVSDFVAGAAEMLVLENRKHDILVMEGQGSLVHPMYSGVTLSMLHGFMPHALVLCHQLGRRIMRGTRSTPMPAIDKMIQLYEAVTEPVFPARVIALSINSMSVGVDEARDAIAAAEDRYQLPATDVIRFGAEKIVTALTDYRRQKPKEVLI